MSSKKLLSDNGYTFEIKKENQERDYLYRTNHYNLYNKEKQRVASFQTTPFPKCCGLRVWQHTDVGYNMRFVNGRTVYSMPPYEIFKAFLSEAWEDDQKQNRPGLYMATIVLHKESKDGEIYQNYEFYDRFFKEYAVQVIETRNPIYTNHTIRTYSFVHPALKATVVDQAGEKRVTWNQFNNSFDLMKGQLEHA